MKYFFLLLYLINSINPISIELKTISIPYLSINEDNENNKLRNLSENYVYGSAFQLNYYYTNLYLGESMQKQGYILDTGSSITTSTCSLCTNCGKHICPPYSIDSDEEIMSCVNEKCRLLNSRCDGIKCSFSISYSEGSFLKGVYINQTIRFGEDYKNQKGHYVPIGCTTKETHLFYSQDANGIMGLSNNDYNFVNILYKFGAIERNVFSLCFSQLGGVFNIGEINNKIHLENVTYVPMIIDGSKYFGITINSMSVNESKIESYKKEEYHNFIDSGTTISYINDNIFNEILDLMKNECQKFEKSNACGNYEYHSDFGHCFYFNNVDELNYAVENYWPIIHFNLDGYDYKWKPQNYLFNITNSKKAGGCMGINKSSGKKITLGSSWIIGHDVIFDKQNELIGLAEANCYQNDLINKTNGLELNDDEIQKLKLKLKSELIIVENKTDSIVTKVDKINDDNDNDNDNTRSLEIIIMILIIIIVILFIIVIIMIIKYIKKKKLANLEINNNNNKINYINVPTDNY